jgi:type IV secretory pathway ATPase VirB11/archaellum biosynthesis ATPase
MQLMEQQYGGLSPDLISNLAELISFELVHLNPLIATLLDDEIEEVFMDSSKSPIYLDHRKFGRCQTSILLTPTELESLKTRVRIEAEQRLDETHPYLKTEIITSYFHVRLSMEISSLAVDEFTMRIRKLHKKIFTLIDLIANNTLSIEASAYLLFNWIHGRNILVIGKPYSGKTTLINSLDILGKPSWRKIYVEDVIESIDQSPFGTRQSRYRIESIEENSDQYSTKAYQVKECLHRTPDSVFIGELIHADAVNAFFYLLKVGLRRCLATAHGESPELMVKRFIYDDNVPATLIGHLDIVVQLEKIPKQSQFIRRVTRITEIKENLDIEQIQFNKTENNQQILPKLSYIDIFVRNPENDQLIGTFKTLPELYNKSNTIKNINLLRGEFIDEGRFISEMNRIQSALDKLWNNSQLEVETIIKEFRCLWNEIEMNE